MTTDDLPQRVATWLVEDGEHRVPDHLDAVLARTATIRQRRGWASLERWLPMDLTARTRTLTAPATGPTARLLVIGLLVLTLVGIALAFAGSRQRLPAPFGLAANGVLLSASDGDIFVQTGPLGERRPLISGPEDDYGAWFSHDGTRFLFWREVDVRRHLLMIANADGTGVRPVVDAPLTAADWFEWSPDDIRVLIVHTAAGRRVISIADVASGSLRELSLPDLEIDNLVYWRPPAGDELIFLARPVDGVSRASSVYSVRLDGSDRRTIVPARAGEGALRDVDVSPDGRTVTYWIDETVPGSTARQPRIHLVDVTTGEDRTMRFDPTSIGESQLRFSPDGKTAVIVLHHDRVRLAVVDLLGEPNLRPIGSRYLGTEQLTTMFSPDARTFVLAFEEPRRPVFVDLASGMETTASDAWNSYPTWQRQAP